MPGTRRALGVVRGGPCRWNFAHRHQESVQSTTQGGSAWVAARPVQGGACVRRAITAGHSLLWSRSKVCRIRCGVTPHVMRRSVARLRGPAPAGIISARGQGTRAMRLLPGWPLFACRFRSRANMAIRSGRATRL